MLLPNQIDKKQLKQLKNGKEVPTFVPNQNTVQDSYFYLDESNRKVENLAGNVKATKVTDGNIFKQGSAWANGYITKSQSNIRNLIWVLWVD